MRVLGAVDPASASTPSRTESRCSPGPRASPTASPSPTSPSRCRRARRHAPTPSGLARLAARPTRARRCSSRAPAATSRSCPPSTSWWSGGHRLPAARRSRDSLVFFVFDDRRHVQAGRGGARQGLAAPSRRAGRAATSSRCRPASARSAGRCATRAATRWRRATRRSSALGAFDLARQAAADDEPRHGRPAARGRGSVAERRRAHARLPGAGVPPARVRGEGGDAPARGRSSSAGTRPSASRPPTSPAARCPGADVSWRVARPPRTLHARRTATTSSSAPCPVVGAEPGGVELHARSRACAARTDAAGRHRLRIDFDRADSAAAAPPAGGGHRHRRQPPGLDGVRAAARAPRARLRRPARERPFVQKGEPIAIDAIVTDLDGRRVAGRPVALRAERLDWEQVEGEWTQVPKDAQDAATASPGREPVSAALRREGGRHLARSPRASRTRRAARTRPSCASGSPAASVPPRRDLEQEKVTLVPDRKEYRRATSRASWCSRRSPRPRAC